MTFIEPIQPQISLLNFDRSDSPIFSPFAQKVNPRLLSKTRKKFRKPKNSRSMNNLQYVYKQKKSPTIQKHTFQPPMSTYVHNLSFAN